MTARVSDPLRLEPSFTLLGIAGTDLAAVRALRAARLYPHAVFSLQQAVEKTVKAVGLATRAIEPKELQHAISHRAIKVYVAALEKLLKLPQLRDADQRQILAITTGYAQVASGHVEEFDDVERPSAAELEQWLERSEASRADADVFASETGQGWDPALTDTLSAISGTTITGASIAHFIHSNLEAAADLYWLGLATLAHAVTSRYGIRTTPPSQLYTDATPLVVHLERLAVVLEQCQQTVRQSLRVAQQFATLVSTSAQQ